MNTKPFVRIAGLYDRGISYRNASTLFSGPFHPSPMGTEKGAYMSSAHKRSRTPRVRRKLHACSVLSPITGWDELRIALPASPSGGHARPGFVGPGFPEDRGRESGKAAVPRVARARRSLFPRALVSFRSSSQAVRLPSSEVPARLADGHDGLPNEARSE